MLQVTRVYVVIGMLALAALGCASSGAAATSGNAPAFADLPAGDPAVGEALFGGEQLHCQACHSLDDTPGVGPSLQGVAERVPEGYDSVEAYLYESILEPDAYVREGYHDGIMPPNSARQLDGQALSDLIAFLAQQ